MKKPEYIFIDRQIEHIRKVQDYMIILEKNRNKLPFKIKPFILLRRAMKHDLSKFSIKLIRNFIRIAEYFENKKFGLSNDHIDKTILFECSSLHYLTEAHHIEHHIKQKTIPTDIDICEMCCDWVACSQRDGTADIIEYFETACKTCKFFMERKNVFLHILHLLIQEVKIL